MCTVGSWSDAMSKENVVPNHQNSFDVEEIYIQWLWLLV